MIERKDEMGGSVIKGILMVSSFFLPFPLVFSLDTDTPPHQRNEIKFCHVNTVSHTHTLFLCGFPLSGHSSCL